MELDPEALSPRPLAETAACPLPYGLTWGQVAPALPQLDVASMEKSRSYRTYAKQGRFQGSDSSCILTIEHPTVDGPLVSRTVFVKRTPPDGPEAAHYALLAAERVPTPRLLVAVDVAGREVIITEFLPTIGVDLRSSDEVTTMLWAIARLNAVGLVPSRGQVRPGRPRPEMDRRRREGLAVLARDPRTGVDVDRWFQAFDRLRRATAPMPEALTHGEFSFQQCGWADRANERELVIFDLATMGRRERFADLTSVLSPAAEAMGVREIELLEVYLGALRDLTGAACDAVAAMTELVTCRILSRFSALYWLTHDAYGPGSDELLDIARRLRADLDTVGCAIGP